MIGSIASLKSQLAEALQYFAIVVKPQAMKYGLELTGLS
jgi:hypothetical protein